MSRAGPALSRRRSDGAGTGARTGQGTSAAAVVVAAVVAAAAPLRGMRSLRLQKAREHIAAAAVSDPSRSNGLGS